MTEKNQLRAAKQKVETFKLEHGWYDLWHIHLDMDGDGNKSVTDRKKFIILALDLLNKITDQTQTLITFLQTFIVIDPTDSSQDAVYVHTPNPNGNNFPYEFTGVNWKIAIPYILKGFINKEKYIIGESNFENNLTYFIKLK